MIAYNYYEIQNISIETDKESYNITNDNIVVLNIYESILKPGISGDITFLDYDFFTQTTPIFGGEKIKITLNDSFKSTLDLEFIITEISSRKVVDKEGRYNVTIQFIERHYIQLLTEGTTAGTFKESETITDVIHSILSDSSVEYFEDAKFDTKIENLYFPNSWTKLEALEYLYQYLEANNNSGYFLLRDRKNNNIRITSYTEVFKGQLNQDDNVFNVVDNISFNYIRSLESKSEGNILYKINNQILEKKGISCNQTTKKLNFKTQSPEEYMEKFNLKDQPISKDIKILGDKGSYWKYCVEILEDDILIKNNNDRTEIYNSNFEFDILINGRFDIFIGDKIYIEYNLPMIGNNNNFEGEYVIHSITHSFFKNNVYDQTLSIIKGRIENNKRCLYV